MKQILRQFTGKLDAAAILALAGTVLLVARWAAGRPMWLDEEMIALNVRGRGFLGLHGALWLGQSAPLGWLMVERAALVLFGDGERSLRLLPVAFGIAVPWTALWVGRRWMSAAGAAALVFLCTFSVWLSFHDLELKPYSGDAWFGLLLPALAAQAIDAGDDRRFLALMRRWWAVAALAQWLSNGALLVAPTTAAVLLGEAVRRRRWRGVVDIVAPAAAWLAVFGLHYALTTRFAVHSTYLRSYWSSALPPDDAGAIETLRWLGERVVPFAVKPGSTSLPLIFWIAAVCGLFLAVHAKRGLGLAFAPVPIAGFALAALGQVPLWERLSLWMVPAFDVGIALLGDVSLGWARARPRRTWRRLAAATGTVLALAALAGVAQATWREQHLLRPGGDNHGLDDRAAVRWLIARRRPGDVVITSHLAVPAVWWYGGLSLADPDPGRWPDDGARVLEADANWRPEPCDRSALTDALRGHSRALVYLGFRYDDQPRTFDDLLLFRLSDLGLMTAYRGFAQRSRVAVFDLTQQSRHGTESLRPDASPDAPRIPADACLRVAEAGRW